VGPDFLLHLILGAFDSLFDRKDLLAATGLRSGMETGNTSARQAGQW
jgi:hypothetical protein